jgi:hypothetical protein
MLPYIAVTTAARFNSRHYAATASLDRGYRRRLLRISILPTQDLRGRRADDLIYAGRQTPDRLLAAFLKSI